MLPDFFIILLILAESSFALDGNEANCLETNNFVMAPSPVAPSRTCWHLTGCQNCVFVIKGKLDGFECSLVELKLKEVNPDHGLMSTETFCYPNKGISHLDGAYFYVKSKGNQLNVTIESYVNSNQETNPRHYAYNLTSEEHEIDENEPESGICGKNASDFATSNNASVKVSAYVNNTSCEWPIEAPESHVIKVQYQISGVNEVCQYCDCDLAEFRDGRDDNISFKDCSPKEAAVKSKTNKMTVAFKTDSTVTANLAPSTHIFNFSFEKYENEIPSEQNCSFGIEEKIALGGKLIVLSNNARNNLNCSWSYKVRGPTIEYRLEVDWHMDYCLPCQSCDHFLISYNGVNEAICQNLKTDIIASDAVEISLVTDGSIVPMQNPITNNGFRFIFEERPPLDQRCFNKEIHIPSSSNGIFSNLEYPNLYWQGTDCKWRISVPGKDSKIRIAVVIAWLDCSASFLSHVIVSTGYIDHAVATLCENGSYTFELDSFSATVRFIAPYQHSVAAKTRAASGYEIGFLVNFEEIRKTSTGSDAESFTQNDLIPLWIVLGCLVAIALIAIPAIFLIRKTLHNKNDTASLAPLAEAVNKYPATPSQYTTVQTSGI